jgi:hypothetical protein
MKSSLPTIQVKVIEHRSIVKSNVSVFGDPDHDPTKWRSTGTPLQKSVCRPRRTSLEAGWRFLRRKVTKAPFVGLARTAGEKWAACGMDRTFRKGAAILDTALTYTSNARRPTGGAGALFDDSPTRLMQSKRLALTSLHHGGTR